MAEETKKPLFRDIDADDDVERTEIESLCVACEEMGTTRLLLTRIPHFREIVLASFECPHCGYANKEVQSVGEIQEKGCRWTLAVNSLEDLGRQVVKADSGSVKIPELDFEVPFGSQPGVFTTVEGLLQRAVDGLEQQQPVRRALDASLADQIDAFILKLKKAMCGELHFTLIVDDPAGNSVIENPNAPSPDPKLQHVLYTRTAEQDNSLGLRGAEAASVEEEKSKNAEPVTYDEILSFATNCPNCQSPVLTNMKPVDIPYFKQVIIMAVDCEACGYRSNEVKAAGGIEEEGTRITVHVKEKADLSRDVLAAETALVIVPELELEVQSFSMGGRFTTIEGLLTNLKDQLNRMHSISLGDSSSDDRATRLKNLLQQLDEAIAGDRSVHLTLDDPAGNSYVQNLWAPDPDPAMEVVHYQRSAEQNEELGLDKLVTDNYSS